MAARRLPAAPLSKRLKNRRRDFNSEAEQQHAEARARLSRKIGTLKRRGPTRLLEVLNAPGASPAIFQTMLRLCGRTSGGGWPYDKDLVTMAWVFCRAVAVAGMRLPRLRGNARAVALESAVEALRFFRKKWEDTARAAQDADVGERRARVARIIVSRDLQLFFEWLMAVDPAWLARLRRCRGCKIYFWQETIGTPKEHHRDGCRVTALRARRRPQAPVTTG